MTCAYAVRVNISKLPGVESVDVTLNRGRGRVELKPGNKVRIEQIWEKVMKNGNSPRETRVAAEGKILSSGDKLQIEIVSGSRPYDLIGDSGLLERLKASAGQRVTMEGILNPPQSLKTAVPIRVVALR